MSTEPWTWADLVGQAADRPLDRLPHLLESRATMPTSPSTLYRASLPSAVRTLAQRDPRLARLVARHGVPPLWARRPGFASLLRIILEQQVSLASAQAIYHRLATAVEQVRPENVLALGTLGLQGLGVTRQKASYACWIPRLGTPDGEVR